MTSSALDGGDVWTRAISFEHERLSADELKYNNLSVIIVGCGLGGLACAISCRHGGLDVLVLEKTPELSEIGAGIQLPPNASRIMSDWGLMDKLHEAGGMVKGENLLLRWQDGRPITSRPGKDWARIKFGYPWHVMHRADYQGVLADEARRLGTKFRFGADVVEVDSKDGRGSVTLASGERLTADIVVGADGLRGTSRTYVLGYVKEPEGSGDLAYRITIPREKLESDPDPFIRSVANDSVSAIWWGPNRHVVLYGVRGDTLANLVLVCPDNLPLEVSRQSGELEEMHKLFEDWDPKLRVIISKVDKALKWKIWTMDELDVWTKGNVALLGDACHPSVPYAASGAAMAVEDGAVLGRLLSRFTEHQINKAKLPKLLELYQDVRKKRAETTVRTANGNRTLYHMEDGPDQEERDRLFANHDWWDEDRSFPWVFADLPYLHQLFGFDTLKSAEDAFTGWIHRAW